MLLYIDRIVNIFFFIEENSTTEGLMFPPEGESEQLNEGKKSSTSFKIKRQFINYK